MATSIVKVDTKAIQATLSALADRATAIVVRTADEYSEAGKFLTDIRSFKKQVGFVCDPFIEAAKQNLETARNEKNKYIRPADELDEIVSRKAEAWRKAEREAAEAEQRRINEERRREAEAKATEERKAAEAQAENDRKKREAEIKEAQKAGEVGKREAARLEKEAAEAETRAKEQAAKDAEATRQNIQDVKVAPAIPKIAGIKARTNWRYRIVDETLIPRKYLIAHDIAIGGMVRATKDKAKAETECPGIECYTEDSV
jgi:type IV secretory pathway VirB10-like protein